MKKNELERKLQRLDSLREPKASLEQYTTPAAIAADVLFTAYSRGDIQGRKVADLGCGNGVFAIGAALLGAKSVVAVDMDAACITVAKSNAESLDLEIEFLNSDVSTLVLQVDTVLQNPPFGAQRRRADRPFLETAMRIGKVIYSLHMADTEDFLERLVSSAGGYIDFRKRYKFEIPHTFAFHAKQKKDIDVILLCIRKGETE